MTPSGIETATFGLVAQYLNQLPRAPGYTIYIYIYIYIYLKFTDKHMLLFKDMEIRFSHWYFGTVN